MRRGRKRTSAQDHRRTDKENQGYGGIKMKDVWIGQIGIWGQRHYQYLKENKPATVNVMRMNGSLKSYLMDINEQAEEMLFQSVKQMAKVEGVNEQLKRQDQLGWVQRMNSIRNRAEELIYNELICC